MTSAHVVAGCRTAVTPRGGALSAVEVVDLASPVIRAVLEEACISAEHVDEVILGNALYGGGNPARVAALAAGLPTQCTALTVDTQCCAGLDAVTLAHARIAAGQADVIVAGGVESFSRAPIRQVRSTHAEEDPVTYERPPFTPWPERDPDMIESAADLAGRLGVTRLQQEDYAIESHRRALADLTIDDELIPVGGVARDTFTRTLTRALCARLPALHGIAGYEVTSATTAVEADGAAAVLVVSERILERLSPSTTTIRILHGDSRGCDPGCPALAPIDAAAAAFRRLGLGVDDIATAELMEAFSVQAIACIDGIGLDPGRVNRRGGGLARGHPIGASGAILAVRLFHDLRRLPAGSIGLAAIAAAGGLGSVLLLRAE